jgi:uncharacterized protein YndB with AHSA1/START domain
MNDENRLTIERILNATPERVFDAWTNPEWVARWWGGWSARDAPKMTAETTVGGGWRFAMQVEDRTVWMSGRYTEISRPHRLAFSFGWEGQDGPETQVVLELEDLGDGRTKLNLVHDLSLAANACVEGWDALLRPLAALLSRAA